MGGKEKASFLSPLDRSSEGRGKGERKGQSPTHRETKKGKASVLVGGGGGAFALECSQRQKRGQASTVLGRLGGSEGVSCGYGGAPQGGTI